MTVFYVHRRPDGSIDAAMGRIRPGYAEEPLDDSIPELAAFLRPPAPPPEATPLAPEDMERLLLQVPGITRAKIDQAKKDRRKPLP